MGNSPSDVTSTIPLDILENILTFVPTASDIISVSQTCVAWYAFIQLASEKKTVSFKKYGKVKNSAWQQTNNIWKAQTFMLWPKFSTSNERI
jgi:hypothetical protein